MTMNRNEKAATKERGKFFQEPNNNFIDHSLIMNLLTEYNA